MQQNAAVLAAKERILQVLRTRQALEQAEASAGRQRQQERAYLAQRLFGTGATAVSHKLYGAAARQSMGSRQALLASRGASRGGPLPSLDEERPALLGLPPAGQEAPAPHVALHVEKLRAAAGRPVAAAGKAAGLPAASPASGGSPPAGKAPGTRWSFRHLLERATTLSEDYLSLMQQLKVGGMCWSCWRAVQKPVRMWLHLLLLPQQQLMAAYACPTMQDASAEARKLAAAVEAAKGPAAAGLQGPEDSAEDGSAGTNPVARQRPAWHAHRPRIGVSDSGAVALRTGDRGAPVRGAHPEAPPPLEAWITPREGGASPVPGAHTASAVCEASEEASPSGAGPPLATKRRGWGPRRINMEALDRLMEGP